jgi:hypothetical protein
MRVKTESTELDGKVVANHRLLYGSTYQVHTWWAVKDSRILTAGLPEWAGLQKSYFTIFFDVFLSELDKSGG